MHLVYVLCNPGYVPHVISLGLYYEVTLRIMHDVHITRVLILIHTGTSVPEHLELDQAYGADDNSSKLSRGSNIRA